MIAFPDICLITPGHLASTPRVIKHADALIAAGYRVHVVSGRHFQPAEPLDAAIVAQAQWASTRVHLHRNPQRLLRGLGRKLARRRIIAGASIWPLAARAQHAGHAALVQAAARTRATFFYGHGGVAGLAAAAAAAKLNGQRFGFDAEDWHEEEADFSRDAAQLAAIRILLRSLLSEAALLTCAAPLIAAAYAATYQVRLTCILNVFPLADALATPVTPPPPSNDHPAIFYWFSQTIGPERGLEEAVALLQRLHTPTVLHLRGFAAPGFVEHLRDRAAGLRDRIVILPPAPASEMVRLAASAHLGLALEQRIPRNRDLCLTNKIFTYLLAGVPQLLSRTSAQASFANQLSSAALLASPEGLAASAGEIDALLNDPTQMSAARAASWNIGRERFCWDHEKEILLELVAKILALRPQ